MACRDGRYPKGAGLLVRGTRCDLLEEIVYGFPRDLFGRRASRRRSAGGGCPMIDHLDHLVLTTRDRGACVRFYTEVLGMALERFGEGRTAFRFGNQKINLHEYGRELEPKAHLPVPGSLDLCFIAAVPLEEVQRRLSAAGVKVVEGPVMRTGATTKIRSVYVRDPDLNLVEISVPA